MYEQNFNQYAITYLVCIWIYKLRTKKHKINIKRNSFTNNIKNLLGTRSESKTVVSTVNADTSRRYRSAFLCISATLLSLTLTGANWSKLSTKNKLVDGLKLMSMSVSLYVAVYFF